MFSSRLAPRPWCHVLSLRTISWFKFMYDILYSQSLIVGLWHQVVWGCRWSDRSQGPTLPHTASPPSQVDRCGVSPKGFAPFSFILRDIHSGLSKRNRQVLDCVLASIIRRFQHVISHFFLHVTNVDNVSRTVIFLQSGPSTLFRICIKFVSFFISEDNIQD